MTKPTSTAPIVPYGMSFSGSLRSPDKDNPVKIIFFDGHTYSPFEIEYISNLDLATLKFRGEKNHELGEFKKLPFNINKGDFFKKAIFNIGLEGFSKDNIYLMIRKYSYSIEVSKFMPI